MFFSLKMKKVSKGVGEERLKTSNLTTIHTVVWREIQPIWSLMEESEHRLLMGQGAHGAECGGRLKYFLFLGAVGCCEG